MRSYSDDQLADAIATSHSWRGALRHLGLKATSASAMRSVRRHADRLELDYSHFTGQRRWSDEQLAAAVDDSTTWSQVTDLLGLAGGSSTTTLRGHALRLGLDTTHLSRAHTRHDLHDEQLPLLRNLSRAGSMLAAAWFEMCGHSVSWPLEPARYDLLVWNDDQVERVQVKTTTMRSGATWVARLSSAQPEPKTYDPDEIDSFFVIDGDLNYYLIPLGVVGGLTAIHVSAYQEFRVRQLR